MPAFPVPFIALLLSTALVAMTLGGWLGAYSVNRWQTPLRNAWLRIRRAIAISGRGARGEGSLAEDLEAAIVRDELFLVHQPKMRARTDDVEAVETLVRWRQSLEGPQVYWLSDGVPRYRASDVERWLDGRSAARPRAPRRGGARAGSTR